MADRTVSERDTGVHQNSGTRVVVWDVRRWL